MVAFRTLSSQDYLVRLFRILTVSTSGIADELETKVHPKVPERNIRTISLLRVYEHVFSVPMFVGLRGFFFMRFRLLVTLMMVSHRYTGTIYVNPC